VSQPLVSLMMIAYNNVQFVKAAIDSVRAQTYENWELIINDDCSTDGTWELAQKLAEADIRIKVFRNETNLKTPKNRAQASKYFSGDYAGHIDADDMLYPYAVHAAVRYLEAHPDVALVYSDTAAIDATGNITGYNRYSDYDPNLAHFGWRPFGVYRMSAFRQTQGYNTNLSRGCEDGDLFMQIAEHHKFARVPYVSYYHRSHGNNTSPNNHSCPTCPDRPVCNYIRVWSKHAGYDPISFTPLNKE
jgi:glycosyltransferase involved in cell wall biosynthesis